MSIISIRLPDKVLQETDQLARATHVPRTEYIRCAIEHMNQQTLSQERAQKLKKASLRVREESMRVNKEFSRIEHDPEA